MIVTRLQRDTGRTLSRSVKNKVPIQSIQETGVYDFFSLSYQRINVDDEGAQEGSGTYPGPKRNQVEVTRIRAGGVINQVLDFPNGWHSPFGHFYPYFYPSRARGYLVGGVRMCERPSHESNLRHDPDCSSPARGLNQMSNLVRRSVTVVGALVQSLNMSHGWTELAGSLNETGRSWIRNEDWGCPPNLQVRIRNQSQK